MCQVLFLVPSAFLIIYSSNKILWVGTIIFILPIRKHSYEVVKSVLNSISLTLGFPGGSVVKNFPASADVSSIPRSGRPPGEGNGNPLQYSCLENAMDRRTLAGYSYVCKELDMT